MAHTPRQLAQAPQSVRIMPAAVSADRGLAAVIDNAIEAEIAREQAEIAAREDRLARLYRARDEGRPGPRLVNPKAGIGPASGGLDA